MSALLGKLSAIIGQGHTQTWGYHNNADVTLWESVANYFSPSWKSPLCVPGQFLLHRKQDKGKIVIFLIYCELR